MYAKLGEIRSNTQKIGKTFRGVSNTDERFVQGAETDQKISTLKGGFGEG
jgi:hypothetical protein